MDTNSTFVAVPTSRAASRREEIVVFWIVRDSACAECGEELGKGRFLRMESERPLCLRCADLDRLVFLERGDAALTRRANRYSTLRAVVVRYSRSRNRYERQGVLVEEPALARAEQECLSDAEARRLARERAAERRQAHDAEYLATFAQRVGDLFPGCPIDEQRAIAEHACQKYLGPDWQVGGGEGATGKRGRTCRSSSRQARPYRVRRTARKRGGARRSARSGRCICGELPRDVATWSLGF